MGLFYHEHFCYLLLLQLDTEDISLEEGYLFSHRKATAPNRSVVAIREPPLNHTYTWSEDCPPLSVHMFQVRILYNLKWSSGHAVLASRIEIFCSKCNHHMTSFWMTFDTSSPTFYIISSLLFNIKRLVGPSIMLMVSTGAILIASVVPSE